MWSILNKPNLSDRMLRWSIELSEYNINYKPRATLKGQVLVDFVVEFIQGVQPKEKNTTSSIT